MRSLSVLFSTALQNEIKSHYFFTSINWDDLEQRKIPPPFIPNVVSIWLCIAPSSRHVPGGVVVCDPSVQQHSDMYRRTAAL